MTVWLSESIAIEPPIPYADLPANERFGTSTNSPSGPVSVGGGDLAFEIDYDHPNGPCAIRIFPWGETRYDATELHATLERIVHDFARADDGSVRTFLGYLQRDDGDGVRSRMYIRNGAVVTEEPIWTEPPGTATGIPTPDPEPSPTSADAEAGIDSPSTADSDKQSAKTGPSIYLSDRAIEFDPPIPYAELEVRLAADRTDPQPSHRRYSGHGDVVDIGSLEFRIDPDHPEGPCAIAVGCFTEGAKPGSGLDIAMALDRVRQDFATTPEGTVRDFVGDVEFQDLTDGSWARLYIRDGHVVPIRPELVWPDTVPGQPCGITAATPAAQAFPDTAADTSYDPEPPSAEHTAASTEETRPIR